MAITVAVMSTMLIGFAALSIDVSVMYNARGQLQRTSDAAAMAAAAMLADFDETVARNKAKEYVAANNVLSQDMLLAEDGSDVVFYRAVLDTNSNGYIYKTDGIPNAVRVTVHYEVPLYFAGIFNRSSTHISATAVAMLIPRDIAIVADLSGSHNDDSEFRHYKRTNINMFDVWMALPIPKGNNGVGNGIDPPPPGNPNHPNDAPGTGPGHPGNQGGNPDPGADPQGGQFGPTWGWMYYWGNTITCDYEPADDPGLMYFPRYAKWVPPAGKAPDEFTIHETSWDDLGVWYQNVGYCPGEIDALLSDENDSSSTYWSNRVAVALGLARWDSGMEDDDGNPIGLWATIPPGHRNNGNGNTIVGSSEITWLVDYPFEADDEDSPGSWRDYIKNYVRSSSTQMYYANHDFRYRFGLKSFINYLLERKPRHSQTPDLADTPIQPMQAVKDAVGHLVQTIYDLESEDQLSLEVYDTTGRHEVDLHEASNNKPADQDEVVETLNARQAGHVDIWTNMGAGVLRAREELGSDRGRSAARKVMILITDGYANVACETCSGGYYSGGKQYAKDEAALAVEEGIQIFTVSVGSYCDANLMQYIADLGGGEHLAASDETVEEMSVTLNAIFQHLGGCRPVELIE
ncbi:MAG: VWA domain-containing protein [Phycisphaerae bacterium]|nr:VWA domain-containing protein [Phycisphaerae bacterium]